MKGSLVYHKRDDEVEAILAFFKWQGVSGVEIQCDRPIPPGGEIHSIPFEGFRELVKFFDDNGLWRC